MVSIVDNASEIESVVSEAESSDHDGSGQGGDMSMADGDGDSAFSDTDDADSSSGGGAESGDSGDEDAGKLLGLAQLKGNNYMLHIALVL